ncbi:MAG: hypothetical protein J5992_02135 [Oscillospiraceae bacterium]|nr:hypothetical protein [Oscillospiraceae bacterium]
MLYKMNTTVMSTMVDKLSLSVSNLEETHKTTAVNLITNFECHSDMMQDKNLRHFYDEVLEQLYKFVKCKEELIELRDILGACIGETAETEYNVKKSINTMFEQATEKEFSTLSKYDAYLYNRKEYDKNYDMWKEKNYNAHSIIGSAVNDAWDETKNMVVSIWDTITGKDMVNEIQVGHIKEVIHSAIQKECEHRQHEILSGGYKDFVDSVYDGKDIIDHGMDIGELFLSGKLSDSEMKELSKLTGIGLDDLGKFMKYGKRGAEFVEYLLNDYSENLKYLDSLESAFSQVENPVVVEQVISELKRKYSDQFFETADMVMKDAKEWAGDKVMDAVFDMTPGTKALKTVADGIDTIRKITGFDKNMDNWSSIVYYNQAFRPTLDNVIDTYLDKYNSGTASMEDINTLNTLIEVDGSIKEVMYERMSIKNEGLADEFSEASDLLKY